MNLLSDRLAHVTITKMIRMKLWTYLYLYRKGRRRTFDPKWWWQYMSESTIGMGRQYRSEQRCRLQETMMYHALMGPRVADPPARSGQPQSLAVVYHEAMVVVKLGVRGRSQCCNLYRHL
jgi:hypothetical protein